MKCIKLKIIEEYWRVSDEVAQELVDKGKAVYVNKKEWKETGRKR